MRVANALVLLAALLAGGIGYRLGRVSGAPLPVVHQGSQGAIAAPASPSPAAVAPEGLTAEERSIIGFARQVSPRW